jgi:hypothetical protein
VYALKRNFTGLNDVTVKNANSSLMDTVALATIRVMTERNGTIAKADINSHLAKIRNSITSGIKNVTASFYTTKKRPFCGLFYIY